MTYASWGVDEAAQVCQGPLLILEEGGLPGVSPHSLASLQNEEPGVRVQLNLKFLVETSAPGGLLRQTGTEASTTEEPCEGKLHAGICAGGVGQPAFLPRRNRP